MEGAPGVCPRCKGSVVDGVCIGCGYAGERGSVLDTLSKNGPRRGWTFRRNPPPRLARWRQYRGRVAVAAIIGACVLGTLSLMFLVRPYWLAPSRQEVYASAPTRGVTGSITLVNSASIEGQGGSCHGVGRAAAFTAGADVSLTDQNKVILGTTKLRDGVFDATAKICRFDFAFVDVPETAVAYQVLVGKPPLASATFMHDELVDSHWRLRAIVTW